MTVTETTTESGKPVKVHRGDNGYVTMVECRSALDNLDSFDVREFKADLQPGTVFMHGAAWEFHATWSMSECNRLGVKMPKGF